MCLQTLAKAGLLFGQGCSSLSGVKCKDAMYMGITAINVQLLSGQGDGIWPVVLSCSPPETVVCHF